MFTEKEIMNLKKLSSKKSKIFTYTVLIFCLIASSWASVSNLVSSHNLAQLNNVGIYDIISRWIDGFSVSESYSGAYCAAYEKLFSAFCDIYITVFFLFLIFICKAIFRKNQKIINFYELSLLSQNSFKTT